MSGKNFVISIHDVAPASGKEFAQMLNELHPRVGNAVSAAVIPLGFEDPAGAGFAEFVRSRCREVALHGYSHCGTGRFHPLTFICGDAAELLGLSAVELEGRLRAGQRVLRDVFGLVPSVFIPPAWCCGALTQAVAQSCGLDVVVTLTTVSIGTRKLPLAVYAWDCGRFRALGYAGELFGHIRFLWRSAIPCVVLHPRDISRAFFPRALALIDRFLQDGFSPFTFAEIASATFNRETLSVP